MMKYCFEEFDMFGSLDWGIQSYNKWILEGGKSKCIDIEQLNYYIILSSLYTGKYFSNYCRKKYISHRNFIYMCDLITHLYV